MNKMKFETTNLTAQNIDKIAELFPNCVTEALDEERSTPERKVYKKAVNFELLKQMLSPEVIDGEEAYEFTWVGKKAAIVEANKPIRKTLRPCPEESKNWDSTENLYIEGDNLEVLKLLQESYLGKVKMIYIDPPYNTGNDFIYRDDFAMDTEEYAEESGQLNEEGNRLFRNTDSNGRFHSDWCSMIYSRLMLARNLLTDDGVIFISIDDNEVENLKKICDEAFGEDNFLGLFIVNSTPNARDYGHIGKMHEFCMFYCKDCNQVSTNMLEETEKAFKYSDAKGGYNIHPLYNSNEAFHKDNRPNLFYPFYLYLDKPLSNNFYEIGLEKKDGAIKIYPPKSLKNGVQFVWRWGKDKSLKYMNEEIVGYETSPGEYRIVQKMRHSEKLIRSILLDTKYSSRRGTAEVETIMGGKIFSFPKPLSLIFDFCKVGLNESDIILDFFSGSATTAHAVMQLNAEDGGHRKFIMVQLPEPCAEDSEAFKAGYKNICEIGKERIRRAGEKIVNDLKEKRYLYPGKSNPSDPEEILWAKETNAVNNQEGQKLMFSDSEGENKRKEAYSSDSYLYHPEKLDIGFRVLKLDDSNMKDVYYSPEEYDQKMLDGLESNIKDDRTDLDLLFGCLVDWNLPLSLPYTSEKIDGFTVHTYNGGDLIACFDENISDKAIKEIAKRQPLRVVFRDSSFNSSPEKINVREIFKMLAPDTRVKVI